MPNYISVNNKPLLVYLNMTYDVWVRDAMHWAELNGYAAGDFEEIISEKVFWIYMNKGLCENRPIVFVKTIYPELR